MADQAFRLDMTMMYAVHDALRRELERIARIAARVGDDPRQVLSTAVGWEIFKAYLRVHHTSEDDAVWPAMYQVLAERPDDLALLDAMEAEHAAIDPALEAIDAALADPNSGPGGLGDLADSLVTVLAAHLKHEESEGLALMDATLTAQQWQHFADVHRERIGTDARRYLPWLLDSAPEATASAVLRFMPEQIRSAYSADWKPAYDRLSLWNGA
jgi:hypothetical protein